MAQPQRVVISTDADDPYLLNDIAEQLARAGLRIDDVLAELATIIGTVEAGDLRALESVPGVLEVEPERSVRLPPPDSPVQ